MATRPTEPKPNDADEKRLSQYGISWDSVLPDGLSVPPGKKLRLSTERGKRNGTGYVNLSPKSIDDVKRWIGVPDEVAARGRCRFECPATIAVVEKSQDLRSLKPIEVRGLHALGQAWVQGDSRLVASYRRVLDVLIAEAVITGVFVRQDIDIYPRSVLEIGSDVRVLWARNIRIWQGGTLRIQGDAKIDCVNIQGGVRLAVPDLDTYRAPLGELTILEANNG